MLTHVLTSKIKTCELCGQKYNGQSNALLICSRRGCGGSLKLSFCSKCCEKLDGRESCPECSEKLIKSIVMF